LRSTIPGPIGFLIESEEAEGWEIVAKYPNPIAIKVTGNCSPHKNWPLSNWEELVRNNLGYPQNQDLSGSPLFSLHRPAASRSMPLRENVYVRH
jgi:hypothetical protein